MIKGRIEALIEREYLERDESDMKLYHYLVLYDLLSRLTFRHEREYFVMYLGLISYLTLRD